MKRTNVIGLQIAFSTCPENAWFVYLSRRKLVGNQNGIWRVGKGGEAEIWWRWWPIRVKHTVDGRNPARLNMWVSPIIDRVLWIPGGCLGFLPSTVCFIFLELSHVCLCLKPNATSLFTTCQLDENMSVMSSVVVSRDNVFPLIQMAARNFRVCNQHHRKITCLKKGDSEHGNHWNHQKKEIPYDSPLFVEVREDHTNPKPSDVKNTVCSVSLDGSGTMEVLVEGAV